MRTVIQRVKRASVTIDGEIAGEISEGLLVLAGFSHSDSESVLKPVAEKIVNMRIFSNDQGRFDHSVSDLKGGLLVVPQFTLFADCSKSRRPEFFSAMEPEGARRLFSAFIDECRRIAPALKVESGRFGADMKVELLNDGPVTIIFDSESLPGVKPA